ncbi:hypothetical protein EV562_114123 [Streptomyces sp. BK208]|uniref:hypothetical protein n=1 Tax=Streptomyces sp. BK208 TaxID=2512150 RepID=UPI0010D20D87|nr:hypothetical protein [Streptomyces sp. BK208]TDT28557.1 hypothetical protein EV562_114123 [Streptomyces sp. BK208]
MPLHAGEHRAVGPYRTGSHPGGPDRRRIRLYGLAAVVVCAVVLPFAVASAGPPDDGDGKAPVTVPLLARGGDGEVPASGAEPRTASGAGPGTGAGFDSWAGSRAEPGAGGAERAEAGDAGDAGDAPARSPLPPGPALAARCGPELTSPAGVEAQTCVLTRGAETWARTYYRNATGGPVESMLSLLGPDGRSVRTHCAVSADDAPGTCETPPDHSSDAARGGLAGYSAIAEFASRAGYGPLLLRAGSSGGSDGESKDGDRESNDGSDRESDGDAPAGSGG